MPKPKSVITEKERSRRFIETAREIGVDETGKNFERIFKRIVPPRKKSGSKKPD